MKLNSLLAKAAISLMYITLTLPASADTRSDIVATLQNSTNIPVEFPKNLPDAEGEKIYFDWTADNNGYEVSFDYTPDCGGATACNIGYFSANKGGQIPSKSDFLENAEYHYVKLSNGYSAVFTNACGAYCTASIFWKINGVVYSVSLKNGTKQEVMKIANSVYN